MYVEPLDSHLKCESSGYKYVENECYLKDLFIAGLIFSICGIAAPIFTQLRGEWHRWTRIKNANPVNINMWKMSEK
jgi:hypothetical protein